MKSRESAVVVLAKALEACGQLNLVECVLNQAMLTELGRATRIGVDVTFVLAAGANALTDPSDCRACHSRLIFAGRDATYPLALQPHASRQSSSLSDVTDRLLSNRRASVLADVFWDEASLQRLEVSCIIHTWLVYDCDKVYPKPRARISGTAVDN